MQSGRTSWAISSQQQQVTNGRLDSSYRGEPKAIKLAQATSIPQSKSNLSMIVLISLVMSPATLN